VTKITVGYQRDEITNIILFTGYQKLQQYITMAAKVTMVNLLNVTKIYNGKFYKLLLQITLNNIFLLLFTNNIFTLRKVSVMEFTFRYKKLHLQILLISLSKIDLHIILKLKSVPMGLNLDPEMYK